MGSFHAEGSELVQRRPVPVDQGGVNFMLRLFDIHNQSFVLQLQTVST